MNFKNALKRKKECIIYSPIKGSVVSLSEVPDQVFQEEQLGPGIAFIPSDGNIYSPVDGTVNMVFPTGHAIGLITGSGVEVLLHVGLDTVELEGKPFTMKVKTGQVVKCGDPLLYADLNSINNSKKSVVTPLIICNLSGFAITEIKRKGSIEVGDVAIILK